MEVTYNTEIFNNDFEIKFHEKNNCKGILKIEVITTPDSQNLLINDFSKSIITNKEPFLLSSIYPITNGLLSFSFLHDSNNHIKKAIVRYLYVK